MIYLRIITLIAFFALAVPTAAGTTPELMFEVRVADGVQGQPVPLELKFTNPTATRLELASLKLKYHDQRIIPDNARLEFMRLAPGSTGRFSANLLVNTAPLHVNAADFDDYQDRLLFREPGDHPMSAEILVRECVSCGGDAAQGTEVKSPWKSVVKQFVVHVKAPDDDASRAWWELVRHDEQYARLLTQGVFSASKPRRSEMLREFDRFGAKYPSHPLAQKVSRQLTAYRATRVKLVGHE